jgi:hypothetical protein
LQPHPQLFNLKNIPGSNLSFPDMSLDWGLKTQGDSFLKQGRTNRACWLGSTWVSCLRQTSLRARWALCASEQE